MINNVSDSLKKSKLCKEDIESVDEDEDDDSNN